MHKLSILFLIVFVICGFHATLYAQSLEGLWKTRDENVSYHFKADSSIVFTHYEEKVFIKKYVIKTNTQPNILLLYINQGRSQLLITALIEIIEDNCIRIEQFQPFISEIPKMFSNMDSDNYKNQHLLFRELTQ